MKRILVAEFKHETNRFSPYPADLDTYRNSIFLFGEDVFTAFPGAETEINAFLDVFRNQTDRFELVPCISFDAPPRGPVSKEVYDMAVSQICRMLTGQGPFDGVLLSLHGAMVSDAAEDGEGKLLEAIRTTAGWDIPVIASLDLHTNCTQTMVEHATALVSCRYYPHTETYEAAQIAARLMRDTLDGNVRPCMGYCRVPYLLPLFPTDMEPLKAFTEQTLELEKDSGVLAVRINHGFFPADIEEMGRSVVTITDGDQAKADSIAETLGRQLWENRERLVREFYNVDTALDEALRLLSCNSEKPVVIADASDNIGSGAVGDTTHILRRVLQRNMTGVAFSNIYDPASSVKCFEAGVGAEVELSLGGWSDPSFSGGPVLLKGRVRALTDGYFRNVGNVSKGNPHSMGQTAVIEAAGNTIIIVSRPVQPLDLASMQSCGVIPSQQRIIVVKSAVHYRTGFGPISLAMLDVAAPGYAVPKPDDLQFRNWGL